MRRSLRLALLSLSALTLASCGGGSGSGPAAPPAMPKVQGAVVKGPLQDAEVELFALNDAGQKSGDPLMSLRTDANGRFSFERAADEPALLAVTRGGSFVDESDATADPVLRRRITLGPNEGFESVLPAGATTLVITPYTNARLLQVRRAAAGADFLAFFASASEQAILAFGFDPAAVIPEPPLAPAPTASTAAKSYAMLLGGAAYAIQAQALALDTVPTFATVRAFIDDLSDGRIDGRINDTPVRVREQGNRPLPTSVDLNSEVLRFTNNNFALYADVPRARVDEDALSVVPTPGNLRPLASDDAYATLPDTPLSVAAPGVLDNDDDPDGDALNAVLATGPTNGALQLASDGSFVYTPAAGFIGNDSFTYSASDGAAQSNLATVSIRVGVSGNEPPVSVADRFSTTEDAPLTVQAPGVLSNDVNQGTGALRAFRVGPPSNGSLMLAPDGSLVYVPAPNFNGTDSFTYLAINDNDQSSDPVTVSIVVEPVNDAPVAIADSFTTTQNLPLRVPARGVLANDSDVDGNPLTVTVETQPAGGTLTLDPDGGFLYTPAENFIGNDSFTYRASDGSAQSEPAAVNIFVGETDDLPIAVDDAFATDEDVALAVAPPGVLGNDSDPEGARLSAVLVGSPQNGTIRLSANGGFRYVPAADFSGSDSFTYQATDGTAQSVVATVTLTVRGIDDAPVAAPDSYSTPEDQALVVATPGVLGNDLDAEGAALTAVLVTGPTSGTLALAANGSFTYTPATDFTGFDSFSYSARDAGASSAPVSVTIAVGPVGDPPIAANDAFTVGEGAQLSIEPAGVLANDLDPEGAALTAVLVSGPTNGNLSLDANGGFSYTHDGSETTADSFVYRASDGLAQSASATVSLTVTPVNDAPVASADSFSTREDTLLTVNAPGVLGNDSDAEGGALTAVMFSAVPPAQGVLATNANGGFSFTPAANFNGTVTFSYRASDGNANSEAATVTISVGLANDLPIAVADGFTTGEDMTLEVGAPGVLDNDRDADGDALTAMLVSPPSSGTLMLRANGSFTYTPAVNFSGMVSFTYRASDGTANSSVTTVTLTVTAADDPPLAVADSFDGSEGVPLSVAQPGVLGNDSDADGDSLTATLVSPPASGTLSLNPNGSFLYTPAANFSGNVSFTYRASDGSAPPSNLATVTLMIANTNDPPVAVPDMYTVAEDTDLVRVAADGVLANDTDPDDDGLTAVMFNGATNGVIVGNPNGGGGGFTFRPNPNFVGTASFTYRARDESGLLSDPAIVTITVTAVDEPPVAVNDTYTTNEDTPLTVPVASGLLDNDSDPDGDSLTAVMFSAVPPAQGVLAASANGGFSFTPADDFNGPVTFTYRTSDGSPPLSNPATVTITVTAVDDTPVANPDVYTVAEDTDLVRTFVDGLLVNDTDADDDSLTAVSFNNETNGTIVGNPNGGGGGFRFRPTANFSGTASFTYRASDGAGPLSNQTTVTITVTPVNDAPVANDDSYTTDEDTPFARGPNLGLLGNDSDPDGDDLTAVMFSDIPPQQGAIDINPDGSFAFSPQAGFSGVVAFTYRANDGSENSNLATVTITVTEVDSPPVAEDDSYNTMEDEALTINNPLLGVLANDSDPDNDPITAVMFSDPAKGTVSGNADGTFTYTPDLNTNGADTFTYRVSDGSPPLSDPATVTITVTADNDAPVAENDSFCTLLDTPLSINPDGVLATDSDVDNSGLGAALVDDVPAAQGTLTFNNNGGFNFTPAPAFMGNAMFTYVANDGSLDSNLATVTIAVGGPCPIVSSAMGAATIKRFPLSKLRNSPKRGAILLGVNANEASGRSVDGIGDVNADGIDDFVIVAERAAGKRGQRSYVVFGNSVGLPSPLDLATLDGGNGYAIGSAELPVAAASSAGDLNGDGFDDRIVVGAGISGSTAHVVFGTSAGLPSGTVADPATLDGSAGFRISAGDDDGPGFGVAGAGDFDNDGIADLLVSMPLADTRSGGTDSGAVYLIFGHRQLGAGGTLDPSLPLGGQSVIRFEGASAGDMAGVGVGAAGDANNDGIADLLIGAPGADRNARVEDAGRSYLIYGREQR